MPKHCLFQITYPRFWDCDLQKNKYPDLRVFSQNMSNFYSTFEKSEIFPFTLLWVCVDDSFEECLKLLKKYGSSILHLRLEIPVPSVHTILKQEDLQNCKRVLEHVPNLKALSLLIYRKEGLGYEQQQNVLLDLKLPSVESLEIQAFLKLSLEFLTNLFTMVPNVNQLEFGGCDDNNGESLALALQNLKLRRQDDLYTPERIKAIERTQKLKELSMYLAVTNTPRRMEPVNQQRDFLKSQADSLEFLSLTTGTMITISVLADDYDDDEEDDQNEAGYISKLQLPIMKNLKRAEFHLESHGKGLPFPIVPLEPDQVPNLKSIWICPGLISAGKY